MKRIIKSDLPPPPPPTKQIKKKWIKKSSQWDSNLKNVLNGLVILLATTWAISNL